MNKLKELRNMAESYAIEYSDKGNGHIQLSNHGILVNYWPLSKNRTCHIANGKTVKHCSNYDAIKLCMVSGVSGLKPKKQKIAKNVAKHSFKELKSNSVVKNLYDGEKPPWEFPTKIMCYTDILRIEASNLMDTVAQMETKEFYQD